LLGVTAHPSAEWIARQLTETYGWRQAPRYIIRDRDCVYGGVFLRRLRAMGIRIGRLHHAHHGRTDVRSGSSGRSGGIALTMSLCLASGTLVIYSNRIKNITTRRAHTYRCRRTRRSPAPSRPSVRRWSCQFWAGCTTNISEREFPTGTNTSPHTASNCSRASRTCRSVRCRPPAVQLSRSARRSRAW
jgi:hypothetical protein